MKLLPWQVWCFVLLLIILVCYLVGSIAFHHVSMNWLAFRNLHITPYRRLHCAWISNALNKVTCVILSNVIIHQKGVHCSGTKLYSVITSDINSCNHYTKYRSQQALHGDYFARSFCSAEDFRSVFMVAKSAQYLRHACPSVRMYQRGSHRTDFREIWYGVLVWRSAEKIKIWLKLEKNIGIFTWGTKYVVLFPTAWYRHKSALFEG
jgi:hypothetical protein